MTPSLKISKKLLDRLQGVKQDNYGKIYGILSKNTLIILEIQVEIDNGNGHDLVNSFPAEIDVCGVINITSGNNAISPDSITRDLSRVQVTDNPLLITYNTSSGEISTSFYKNSQLEPVSYSVLKDQEILSQLLYVRLQACLPLSCELSKNGINEAFLGLRKVVSSGIMSFGFDNSTIYLLGDSSENGVVGITGNPAVGDLCSEGNEEGGTRSKKGNFDIDVLYVQMSKNLTKDRDEKSHAPICILDKKQFKSLNMSVSIDAMSCLNRQTKVGSLYEILVESAIRNLRLMESALLQYDIEGISRVKAFHFYPQECGHFITRFYPEKVSEDSLKPEREQLHQEFILTQPRPTFRRANAHTFKTTHQQTVGPLTNPHEGLKPTDNGGQIAAVKGKYAYYHYCQNKMDDNGWGCAYRSLQTLASWFILQGYIDQDKQVPTFGEIQKCLVDIGDKPRNFVGSKQWIGSTEVNFVLDTLLGVTCKILYVSSGEEMASKGPELLHHFENHGAPVMIGGGVLAHTILGVDYNSRSGGVKFLILDPHYTGGEDLHVIQSKGWVGWKGVDFWDKTAYYNMCLPQVPMEI